MRIKRKTEEKKMSMSKNIARLAVTAGLTAALSFGGVMAPATMAFAENVAAPANSITINKNANNGSVKYKAYQIFEADVVDETGKTGKTDKVVSNVEWAAGVEDKTQEAIIAAINEKQNGALKATASAQDVADWLTANITGTTNTTVLKDTDLLNTLAGLVAKNVTPTNPTNLTSTTDGSFAADTKVSFDKSGYYLFLTDTGTLASDESKTGSKNTATSPIYAVVGAGDVEVTEKTSIPTVKKQVKDGKSNSVWADKADSQMGENIEYQLTGSVADNVDTFGTYYYEFHDELSEGLTAAGNSIKVYAGLNRKTAKEVTTGFAKSVEGQSLTVKFDDLKTAVPSLSKDMKVFVEYTAKLDPDKASKVVVGDEGNYNTVKLIYSNNPGYDSKGESVPYTVRDYTYGIDVTKVGSDADSKGLEGVEFTLQEKDDTGNYITANGVKTTEMVKLKTDSNGKINVGGLDEGTYILKEVTPAPGYNNSAANGVTFTIKRDSNQNNDTVTLENSKIEAADGVVKDNSTTTSAGKLSFTIVDKKGSGLPLTGLNGVTFTWIAGGAVLCIGVAHLIRSRKQAEESEQE